MNALQTKVKTLSTETLKEMVEMLFIDQREGSEIALNAVLCEIEKRLPEAEFVKLCDSL